jgi:hypothetical protein
MRRILFNLAAVASLILCLLVCGVWAKTYSHGWGATWLRPDDGVQSRWVTFRVARGEIEIMICHTKHHADPRVRDTQWTIGWYGLSWMRFYQWYGGHDKLHFYDSHLACLFALLPSAWVVMTVRRRRRLQLLSGHCRKCGYDLRASTDRCPECGTRIRALG